MKYIYFVLLAIFVMLFAATPAASLDPSEPIIHYSDSVVERDTKLSLAQGYTLEIVDINEDNGDVWVEIRNDGKLVENGDGTGKENDPFEYILTIEAEDADDEDEEYLIFRVTPKEIITSGTDTTTRIRIEQFSDPTRDINEFLIHNGEEPMVVGKELNLKEGYTLSASDLDVDEQTITVTLKKNDHMVKEVKEMEPGDVFSYYKNVNGEVRTIFIATIEDFFEGKSQMLLLEEISQREDVEVESNVEISIEGSSGKVIRDGERAIISYELENDASKVTIYLDDDIIEVRNDADAKTYEKFTEKLDMGTYDVIIETVSTDGSVSSKETSFTVDGASAIGDNASDEDISVSDQVEDMIQDGENASSNGSDSAEDITKSTAFTYIVVAVLLALTAFFFKREFS